MIEDVVEIVNRLGLHARAAARLVKLAGTFKSDVTLESNERCVTADAKSILSVLTLAASYNTSLVLRVNGEDEQIAFDEITNLFENGFGEL